MAVDANHVYWANGDGMILVANLDGSDPRVLADHIAEGLAVDGSHLYWTDEGDGQIWRANLDGTNAQAIVSGQDSPRGVAVGP